TRVIDGRGVWTDFSWNENGKLTMRVDGANDPLSDPTLPRTTVWTYDTNFPAFATSIEGPFTGASGSRVTSMIYHAGNGNLLSRAASGLESTYSGGTFSLGTDYSGYNGAGNVGTVDPPGYGPSDQTTYTYAVPGANGTLPDTRTDPLVGTTSFGYDAFNRSTRVTDANGVKTDTEYDALDRVTRRIERGANDLVETDDLITLSTYNDKGDLFCVKRPAGDGTQYLYDGAGRLTEIRRGLAVPSPTSSSCLSISSTNFAERMLYALDEGGHRVNEKRDRGTSASAWTTQSETSYVYSTMCHLDKTIQAPGQSYESVTEYSYDCNGNLEDVWDPLHPRASFPAQPSTTYSYDAINRLSAVSQPWSGPGGGTTTTAYLYDPQDHLTQVTDANGTVTSYVYSDRDLMTSQVSEVSGTATYAYNEHGQLSNETDGRGISTIRTVDAADRVTLVDLPGTTLDVTYAYGSTPANFDVGRLTGITRNSATISYSYDRWGRTLGDGTLGYTYDGNSNPLTITYPGGLQAIYTYDKMNRPISLQSKEGAAAAVYVVKNSPAATYKAYGPLASLVFNTTINRTETRSFDLRYQPTSIVLSSSLFTLNYTTDKIGNVTQQQRTFPAPSETRDFTYQDWQYYLASASGPWGTTLWTYDPAGNRLSENTGGAYTYLPNAAMTGVTSELAWVIPGLVQSYGYTFDTGGYLDLFRFEDIGFGNVRIIDLTNDAAGQLSGIVATHPSMKTRTNTMLYDGRNFLKEASELNTGGYVRPTYSSAGTLYSLDRLPVTGGTTERINVLYFAGSPIALWKKVGTASAATTLLVTDHLGTPIASIQQAGASVDWYGGFKPFGEDWQAGTAQDSLAKGIFLRMPGQWKDPLWGTATYRMELFYNVNRWYEPQTGRYASADPTGLRGGFNVFGYSGSRPLMFKDPLGLDFWVEGPDVGEGGAGLHQSFCVGTYGGKRFCQSFGVSEPDCLFGCKGEVYEDTSPAGDINWPQFRSTSSEIDEEILKLIVPRTGRRGSYSVLGSNCRDYSQALWREMAQRYGFEFGWSSDLGAGTH
ncbi:MAG: RHS repeat-associated core domain-containing protein, partial [Thermoanaerobaculia bacterium]